MSKHFSTKLFCAFLLSACGAPSTLTSSNADAVKAYAKAIVSDSDRCSCAAPDNVVITLPKDDAGHSAATEWWYYTGHVKNSRGDRYGFELVFFQLQASDGSFYTTAHFALSDAKNQKFYWQTSGAPGAYPLVDNGFDLSVPAGWSLTGGDGSDELSAQSDDFGIDLSARASQQVEYNDGDGHAAFPDGTANYYYSRPKMALNGSISVNGKRMRVSGDGWFDHQWGALPFTTWTWYGIQLSNGEQVTAFQIRTPDDSVVIAQGGTFVGNDCTQQPLGPTDLSMTWSGSWTSPHSGLTYPTDYAFAISAKNLQLSLTPTLQDQELQSTIPAGTYREADATVTGTEGSERVSGSAFIENVSMTQYQ